MSTIGVDTGGTFTDLVYLRDDGGIEVAKRPSTPLNSRKASSTWWRPLIRVATS
jgi:N-methylhydantoinase A/oxoprolinase/acetone carboxylase beta subunit